jgi:hypothetical protein
MPRLVKGAKWVYGWAVVGPKLDLVIPPEAWREYGFEAGQPAIFLPASRRSGGFAVSALERIEQATERLEGGALGELGRGQFAEGGRLMVPQEVAARTGTKIGDRLLAARGSRYGLGFIARGPIYERALNHPELETFGV